MSRPVRRAFETEIIVLPLSALLPLRPLGPALKKSRKYKQIASTIKDVGIVEPLVVARQKEDRDRYLLLDGHMRLAILIERGETEVRCLVSSDDEAFTFNRRVNRISPIQEHYMIISAIRRGVSEERLARALNVDVKAIKRRRSLLNGISTDVEAILKDKTVNPDVFDILRKMKPMRQLEVAENMVRFATFTATYAKAQLVDTPQQDLIKPVQSKRSSIKLEDRVRMERQLEGVQRSLKEIESRCGEDEVNLMIASTYLSKLVSNKQLKRYLNVNFPQILEGFETIITATSLKPSNGHRQ